MSINIPREHLPARSSLARQLTILASALTAASIAVNLMLQVVQFLQKRPVQPNQRTKLDAAGLTITVLKHLPSLIRQVRLFIDLMRG